MGLVVGTRQRVAKLVTSNGIGVSGFIVPFYSKLRVLVMTLDKELTFDDHISEIVLACNYYLGASLHICPFVDQDTANTRLDYCIANLNEVTKHISDRLYRVQVSLMSFV